MDFFSIPKDFIASFASFIKEHFLLWIEVIKNPINVLKKVDFQTTDSMIPALKFGLFTYLLVLILALPSMILVYSFDISKPIVFLLDFIVTFLSFFLLGVIFHISGKIFFGHGKFYQSLITGIYLTAFWPISVLGDYILLPCSPGVRNSVLNGSAFKIVDKDYIYIIILMFAALFLFIYLITKVLPVFRLIHSFGNFRSILAAIIGILLLIIVSQLFIFPIYVELTKLF